MLVVHNPTPPAPLPLPTAESTAALRLTKRSGPPAYWEKATVELTRRDRTMARLIAAYSGETLVSRGEPFVTLLRSIIGQQISVKAADAVWARFVATLPALTPQHLAAAPVEALRAAGLSQQKVRYVHDIARHGLTSGFDTRHWGDDEAVIRELSALHGVGRWTAEMFLIFALLRPNVLPLDDLGLQKAVRLHYPAHFRSQETPAAVRTALRALGESRWQPWSTVAVWYLWRSLDPANVAY